MLFLISENLLSEWDFILISSHKNTEGACITWILLSVRVIAYLCIELLFECVHLYLCSDMIVIFLL